MECVRAWLNSQIENVKCHVCSLHLGPLLKAYLEEQGKDNLEVYVDFIHDKYAAFSAQDIKTLIIPYMYGKHWTLYIVGEHGFFHFNSLVDSGLHSDYKFRRNLAKLWATWSGHDEDADIWVGIHSSHVWIQMSVPQKNSDWAYEFYMLKNIMEYTKTMKNRSHTLCEVIGT